MSAPYVLLDDRITGRTLWFDNPLEIIQARHPAELKDAFSRIAAAKDAGHWVAGFCSYELGYCLEPKLNPLLPEHRDLPLIQMGVFKAPNERAGLHMPSPVNITRLHQGWSEAAYDEQFKRVQKYIRAGDVYQINLTFPVFGQLQSEVPAQALYDALIGAQPVRYGGAVSLGGADIVSLSPELFFERRENNIRMRPMKGTLKRSAANADDAADAIAMTQDAKSRAENLMIVDLLRNDLSRIAERGSVTVKDLFALETYPTLHQMVSGVEAKVSDDIDFKTLMRNLFPCGSVTGAPKIRAMEIIHELESRPRGAYCGATGYITPDGDACFNVGIRTLTVRGKTFRYDTGSGVVADSQSQDEFQECLLKTKVLGKEISASPLLPGGTNLIETLGYRNGQFQNLERHLNRLSHSADGLGFEFSHGKIMQVLKSQISGMEDLRVRLTLAKNGEIALTTRPLIPLPSTLSLALSKYTVNPETMVLPFKTSERAFYDREQDRLSKKFGADEAVFLNAVGQAAEGSFTSLFLKKGDRLLTPALAAGVLPGVLRESMIANGEAEIATLYLNDLSENDGLFVGNSLRGLMPARLDFIESD